MRRPWILRFAWLLWLASLGTAVLPLAHDLSHRHGLPVLVGSSALATPAPLADPGSAEEHAPSDAEVGFCLVCAHLGSQHLSLPEAPARLPSLQPRPQAVAATPPAQPAAQVAWLRPAPRAPPAAFSL